jgi:hypothetical protein
MTAAGIDGIVGGRILFPAATLKVCFMSRVFPIACLAVGLLAAPARADDANRYEIVVVPSAAGDGKTEAMLIDRQTGKTWLRTAEFDPTTFAVKDTYWVPQQFKLLPPEENKPFLPPN